MVSAAPDARSKPEELDGKAVALCFGLGVWGVFTGFALFLLGLQELERPWMFLLVMAIAVVASWIIESVWAIIEGRDEPGTRGPRVASTILLIAIAELFVGAVQAAPTLAPELMSALGEIFLGETAAATLHPAVSLIAVALVWMIVGGVLAVVLLQFLADTKETGPQRMAKGALSGGLAGALVAPFALLLCVILLRIIANVWLMLAHHDVWQRQIDQIAQVHALVGLLVLPMKILGSLWYAGWWGPWLVGGILVFALVSMLNDGVIGKWILWATGVVLFLPLLADLGALLWLLLLGAIVWAAPAAALGAFAPLLREPSEDSTVWGRLALVGAVLLTIVTVLRLGSAWYLLPAALLLLTALLMRRGGKAESWWPLLAMTAALAVTGVTWVLQQATFGGVFERMHAISTPEVADPEPPLFAQGIDPARLRAYIGTRDLRIATPTGFEPFELGKVLINLPSYADKRAAMAPDRRGEAGDRHNLVLRGQESVEGFHREFEALDGMDLTARHAATVDLIKRADGTARVLRESLKLRSLNLKHDAAKRDRATYFENAVFVLQRDKLELDRAAEILAAPPPRTLSDLGTQLARADTEKTTWRFEATRKALDAHRKALRKLAPALEHDALLRLELHTESTIEELAALDARVAEAGWISPKGKQAAEALRGEIATRRYKAEAAIDTALHARAGELPSIAAMRRVAATDALLADIAHEKPRLGVETFVTRVTALESTVTAQRERWFAETKLHAMRLLELSICGSLGCWISVALLGGWQLVRRSRGTLDA